METIVGPVCCWLFSFLSLVSHGIWYSVEAPNSLGISHANSAEEKKMMREIDSEWKKEN